MKDIRQVIVPVDFEQHTDKLVKFAICMANKLDAKVTFVHVVKEGEYYSDYDSSSFEEFEARIQNNAEKKMAAIIGKNKISCPGCTGVLLSGDPVDCIVEYAKDQEIDLIIMATHGSKGIEKILLGSVADRVLQRAHCPTLVFNPYKGERGEHVT